MPTVGSKSSSDALDGRRPCRSRPRSRRRTPPPARSGTAAATPPARAFSIGAGRDHGVREHVVDGGVGERRAGGVAPAGVEHAEPGRRSVDAVSASALGSAAAAGATRPGRPIHAAIGPWSTADSKQDTASARAPRPRPRCRAPRRCTGPVMSSGLNDTLYVKWPFVTGTVVTCVAVGTDGEAHRRRVGERIVAGRGHEVERQRSRFPPQAAMAHNASAAITILVIRPRSDEQGVARRARDANGLLAAGLAAHDGDVAAPTPERFREQLDQRFVGRAVDGRRRQLHLEPIAVHRAQPLARGARHHLHVEGDGAVGLVHLQRHASLLDHRRARRARRARGCDWSPPRRR